MSQGIRHTQKLCPKDVGDSKEKYKVINIFSKKGVDISNKKRICELGPENDDSSSNVIIKSQYTGTVKLFHIKKGDVISVGSDLVSIEECCHPTLLGSICADCGITLEDDTLKKRNDGLSMEHTIPDLKVTRTEAEKIAKLDIENLLNQKKLVLLVDLDQTLVHTTNDDVPPNLKDVFHFKLIQHGPWYHTRLRSYTKSFLENMSKLYELHICTFGVREYAHHIAHFLDPTRKYFGQRILSRNECLDPMSKKANLMSLFPCGDNMVVIIDDRTDVWSFAPNVVQVLPYHYFRHTGDINAPKGLQKNESDDTKGIDFSDLDAVKAKQASLNGSNLENENMEVDYNKKKDVDSDVIQSDDSIKGEPLKSDESISKDKNEDKTNVGEKNTDVNESDKEKDDTLEKVKETATDKEISNESEEKDTSIEENEKMEVDKNKVDENDSIKGEPLKSDESISKDKNEDKTNVGEKNTEVNESDKKKDDTLEKVKETATNKEISNESEEKDTSIEENEKMEVDENKEKDLDSDTGKLEKSDKSISEDKEEDTTNVKEKNTDNNVVDKEKDISLEKVDKEKDIALEKDKESTTTNESEEKDTSIEVPDNDDYLLYLEDILKKLHEDFFLNYDPKSENLPDLKEIVPKVRSSVLAGLNIVFSGVVPQHVKLRDSKVYFIATSLGASVSDRLVLRAKGEVVKGDESKKKMYTTHMVAANQHTEKVHHCRKQKSISIVTPNWLWACAERWECCDERLFPLTSETEDSVQRLPPLHCYSLDPMKDKRKDGRAESGVFDDEVSSSSSSTTTEHRKRSPSGTLLPEEINPLFFMSDGDRLSMSEDVDEALSGADDDEESNKDSNGEGAQESEDDNDEDFEQRLRKKCKKREGFINDTTDEDTMDLDLAAIERKKKLKQLVAEMDDEEDELPSVKFRQGGGLPSDDSDNSSNSGDGEGNWTQMGEELERELQDFM